MKTMSASTFKARCLAVMDEVESTREPVTLTKKGRPVAKIVPAEVEEDPLAVFRFPGLEIVGDIESPAMDLEDWEALR